jgi:hypothetical protein
MWATCPGCGRRCPLVRPREAAGGRPAAGWRRKQHTATGRSFGAGQPGPRCRYPTALNPDEINALEATCD